MRVALIGVTKSCLTHNRLTRESAADLTFYKAIGSLLLKSTHLGKWLHADQHLPPICRVSRESTGEHMTFSRLDHVRRMRVRKPHESAGSTSLSSRKPDKCPNPEKAHIRVLGVVQNGRVIWNDAREDPSANDR